jgi:hypothetical protein
MTIPTGSPTASAELRAAAAATTSSAAKVEEKVLAPADKKTSAFVNCLGWAAIGLAVVGLAATANYFGGYEVAVLGAKSLAGVAKTGYNLGMSYLTPAIAALPKMPSVDFSGMATSALKAIKLA